MTKYAVLLTTSWYSKEDGFIELEDFSGGDAAVIRSARICYQSADIPNRGSENLIRHLMKGDHGTPFEKATFTFLVRAPLVVSRQWMRYRVGWSFNEKSLRYCLAQRDWWTPIGNEEKTEVYDEFMFSAYRTYELLVKNGWPKEQARLVIPLGYYTEFIAACNARSLMHWLKQRLQPDTQWEHQQYAQAALEIFRDKMPITAAAFEEVYLTGGYHNG